MWAYEVLADGTYHITCDKMTMWKGISETYFRTLNSTYLFGFRD